MENSSLITIKIVQKNTFKINSMINKKHWVKIDENDFFPKLGIIQALLQTMNEKLQN